MVDKQRPQLMHAFNRMRAAMQELETMSLALLEEKQKPAKVNDAIADKVKAFAEAKRHAEAIKAARKRKAEEGAVRKPEKPVDHALQAEIFMSQWSDTDVHGPEHFMKYMPEGKPSYLPGRPIFHSHKDGRGKTIPLIEVEAEKRFDDMESHILFLAAKFDFCADDIK
eukprot:jgi/Tetstr1/422023/TSEL_012887.t1